MSNADTPAVSTGGDIAAPTPGSALGELPPRVRVHALAKLLGSNSRDILAKLAELGEPARSAQSSVPRDTAIRVAEALAGQSEPEPEPEPAAQTQPQPEPEPAAQAQPQPEPEPEPEPATPKPMAHVPVFAAPSPLFLPPEPPPAPPMGDIPEAGETPESEAGDGEFGEEEETTTSSSRRRRRRGRRGRGRGKGGEEAPQPPAEAQPAEPAKAEGEEQQTEPESTEAVSAEEPEEPEPAEGVSRRRRRRRRRKSADEDVVTESTDDPPNTVVHVREPKTDKTEADKNGKSDGVRSVRGSTRLEAKRQRRRDGREAGRRRAPILSEAEFLARREAVERTMVVAERGDNTQIGVLEDGVLVEHFVTSQNSGSIVGNVYLGRVQNVLPSMEAAFVDIGRGRNAVLYAGEVDWDAAGLEGKSRKIEQALATGDNVLVQVTKDPVGHKGARLTTQISLPGRFLVYVPSGGATGISRKLPENERRRLKDILKRIVPEDAGVIIRTASEGISEEELERDVRRLKAQWEVIKEKAQAASAKKSGAPALLYEEPDLLVKVVRDLFTEDFSKLEVQGDDAWETIYAYVQHVAPDLLDRLKRYTGTGDVFADYRIDEQLTKALDRKVWLPSGGYLVIDRTEAMTVIDVNTGKFTGSGGNLEETVTRNNLESAEEIVRQLRLRDIGGIIVIDFIDMVLESNRELVLRRLTECLGRDRTRHQVAEVTSLGLVQMTRKRVGTGLLEAFSTTCEHCKGRGVIVSTEPQRASGGNGANGGHQHGSRRSRGRSKAEEPAAEHRVETPAPTPEQRESVVSAVQAIANATLAASAKDQSAKDQPAKDQLGRDQGNDQPGRDQGKDQAEPAKAHREGREEDAEAPSRTAGRPSGSSLNGRPAEPHPRPQARPLPEVSPESKTSEHPLGVAPRTGSGTAAEPAPPAEASAVTEPKRADAAAAEATVKPGEAPAEPAAVAQPEVTTEPEPAPAPKAVAEPEVTAKPEAETGVEAAPTAEPGPEPEAAQRPQAAAVTEPATSAQPLRPVRRRRRRVVSRPAGPPVHVSDS